MSKKNQSENKEITLDDFIKMTEVEQQGLPSEKYLQLLSEQKEAEKRRADLKEAEQIKAKHYKAVGGRKIFLIEVDDAKAWLKSIDRKLMSMIASVKDPIEQAEILLDNLWLEGDERLKNDDDYFLGACNQLQSLIHVKVGRLKEF